jgi:hypothetical protein
VSKYHISQGEITEKWHLLHPHPVSTGSTARSHPHPPRSATARLWPHACATLPHSPLLQIVSGTHARSDVAVAAAVSY